MPESKMVSRVGSPELASSTVELMADIVRLLVNHPDLVDMKTRNDGRTVTLLLSVASNDLAKVIGNEGRTVRSLRIVLGAISRKSGVLIELEIQTEHP